MIRILKLEIRRIVKAKSTWLLAAIATGMSLVMALLVVSFVTFHSVDENGSAIKLSGTAAVRASREAQAPYEGYIEAEFLTQVSADFHALYSAYGGEIPNDIYAREIAPVDSFLFIASQMYRDPATFYFMSPHQITPAQAGAFYTQRIVRQEEEDFAHLSGAALEKARALEAKVEKPFYFASWDGWGNAGEYLTFTLFILAMVCAVLAAPAFASGYQTGADNILRCSRHGRRTFANVKIIASIATSFALFMLCMLVYLGTVCVALGTGGLKTSLQMVRPTSPTPLTIGGLVLCTAAAGALSILAITCFTLLISSKSEGSFSSLILSLGMVLLPTFLRLASSVGIVEWLRCLLPSSGVGIGSGIYYELAFYNTYLTLGPLAVWAPWVILLASVVWVAACLVLTKKAYANREA